MTTQISGEIDFEGVQTEFNGANPIALNEYYSADTDVPASGAIKLSNFYDKTGLGVVWCCGYAAYSGHLGNYPGNTNRISPLTVSGTGTNWKYTASGYRHSGGIKSDGTLWMWGRSVGNGSSPMITLSSPRTVSGGGTTWKSITLGHGCEHSAVVKTDGTLWAWGYNTYGQVGINTGGSGNITSSPRTVSGGGTTWRQAACGRKHTMAIKTDGTLWGWGYGTNGQLDYGGATNVDRSSPIKLGADTTWRYVSCGWDTTGAIKTNGTLWTWGGDTAGKASATASPQTVSGGGTTWRYVSIGSNLGGAIKNDGTLWMFGANAYGQLGDLTITTANSPVTVAGNISNWVSLACGDYHSAATTSSGQLFTWGSSFYGALMRNDYNDVSSPTTTVGNLTRWKQVGTGQDFAQALKSA